MVRWARCGWRGPRRASSVTTRLALRPAPQLGEHGREVLAELGLDAARIDALLARP